VRFSQLHSRNPGAGDRAAAQLRADAARSDALIAVAARCTAETIARIRRQLEQSGSIPVVPASARVPQAPRARRLGTPRVQLGKAAHQLTIDAARSNEAIAALSGTSVWAAREARKRLERIGIIPAIPARQRTRKPYPQLRSPARDAILALGPDATPRAVADLAGVSMQAAWRALQRLRPRLRDCAAAAEAFQVIRPAGTSPSSAVPRHAPQIPAFPPAPDWRLGLCTTVPPRMRSWWTSSDRDEREAAARMCQGCPVQPECAGWSLALPVTDPAVYGGMSQAERLRRKRAALRELAREALAGWRG
jgi:hypothetical protein